MSEVTHILSRIEEGDPTAAAALLPLVYDELRQLAARNLANEAAGHTLQPTALVHEAYLRLVKDDASIHWNHRGHFYAAAAQAMRRILIDHARGRQAKKRSGPGERVPLVDPIDPATGSDDELLALDVALEQLEAARPELAQLVTLRYFGGQSMTDAAKTLGISLRTAERNWTYAKAWLKQAIADAG